MLSLNNLITRSITGLIFITIIIVSIFLNKFVFAALSLLITVLAILEFNKGFKNSKNISIFKPLSIISGVYIFGIIFLLTHRIIDNKYLFTVLLILPAIMLFELYRKKENPFLNIALTFLPSLYIALPLSLLTIIQQQNEGKLLLIYFLTIWLSDSMAYLVGMAFGKRKLFERISPKKSWEGFIGSAIITLVASLFYNNFLDFLETWQWLLFTLITIISATFGDLLESLFKRSVNIKDSGTIMPGHGGILDRFDAVLYSAPFIFVFLQFIN